MKRTDWKYLIDTLLFVGGCGAAVTGFLLGIVIPSGPAAPDAEKYFLGLHRHQWGGFHFALSIAFIAFLLVHLVLEWSWIRGKARQLFGSRWKGVLILTAAAVGATLFLFWLFTGGKDTAPERLGGGGERRQALATRSKSIVSAPFPPMMDESQPESDTRSPEDPPDRLRSEPMTNVPIIDGRVSLLDIQRMTGIDAKDIALRLGLPPGTPFDVPLGRLRRAHGFSMDDVRRAVESPDRRIGAENDKNKNGDSR